LDRIRVRSALFHPVPMPHAEPRLGGFAALPTTDSTTSAALLSLKGRSGARLRQAYGAAGTRPTNPGPLQALSLNQHL
jgi:hypothetical protein